jgi:hypothetical protein
LLVYRFGALSHLKQSRSAALPSEPARLSLEIAALGGSQTLVVKRRLLLIG